LAAARPSTAPGVRRSLALRAPFREPRSMVAHRRLPVRGARSVAASRGNVEGTKRERNPSEQGLRWPALTHRCGDHGGLRPAAIPDGRRETLILTERGGFEPPMDGNAHTGFRDRDGPVSPEDDRRSAACMTASLTSDQLVTERETCDRNSGNALENPGPLVTDSRNYRRRNLCKTRGISTLRLPRLGAGGPRFKSGRPDDRRIR
jgi:hypothetical protein